MAGDWLDRRFRERPDSGYAGGSLSEAWQRWRASRLARLLLRAASASRWYRQRLEAGLAARLAGRLRRGRPEEFPSLLAELPFTGPEDLAADSDAFLAVGQGRVAGVVSVPTSGTSGRSKRVYSTAADLEETVSFFEYGMRFLVSPGRDRVALAMSAARPGNVGDLLGRALARWQIPFLAHGFVPAGAAEEESWLAGLLAWKPSCLVGVPPQMLSLVRHPRGAALAGTLRTLLLSGEVADDRLVAELEKSLPGGRVFRHYGLTETGLGGAVECGRRNWPHLRDDLWAEIIGPDGAPRPDGQSGELVVTPLTRLGMPLLRYRTGDEARLLSEPCPCASIFPRLEVFGRLSDRLTLGGRSLRVSDFEEPLLALPFVRDFSLTLRSEKPPELDLRLNVTPGTPPEAAAAAVSALKRWLGEDGGRVKLNLELSLIRENDPAAARALGGKRRLARGAAETRA